MCTLFNMADNSQPCGRTTGLTAHVCKTPTRRGTPGNCYFTTFTRLSVEHSAKKFNCGLFLRSLNESSQYTLTVGYDM